MAIRPPGWEHSPPPPSPPMDELVQAINDEIAERRQARAAETERRETERETRRIDQAHDAALIVEQSRVAAKLRDEGLTVQEVASALTMGMSTTYDRIGRGMRDVKAWANEGGSF